MRIMHVTLCFVIVLLCVTITEAENPAVTKGDEMTSKGNTDRYERGLKALKALDADAAQGVLDGQKDISPEMGRYIVEFAFGDVYSRPGLDPKSRQIATMAALTAMGNAKPQLKFHIGASLNIGVTPEEIIDVMYITTVFAGFPSGLNGISAAREVFQAKGVSMKQDRRPAPGDGTRHERGLETLNRTSKDAGERVIKSLSDIAPDMAQFIIDFSYGDIFSREILSPKHKEIAMIAVCVAKGTMEPQMKVHLHAALNVGCTKQEIVELMYHMSIYAGFPAALNGLSATRQVFQEYDSTHVSK
ncbi:MAG TPA: carboxymuconolactone decarboxylase family protein [Desulfomonilaceae bacterium]|nr:carboxymuconolactone decarboxylase family protein [Desulfomonilaceae bacterium]